MAQRKAIVSLDTHIVVKDEQGDVFAKVTINYSNGETATKTLTFDDYCSWLLGAKKEATTYCHLPRRSNYYLDGMTTNEEGTFKVILYVPAGKHQMVNNTYDFADIIPYPALLFKLSFVKGVCQLKECFAVVDEKESINDSTILYRYPYGNVSSNGDICMGNIAVKCKALEEADFFPEEFFLGVDAGHYYQPKVMTSKNWNQGKLMAEASKKEVFPKNWLQKNGMTYKDIKF